MMRHPQAFVLVSFGILLSGAALAEPIPEYALAKDYENCMGGLTPQQDVQRAQYCSCMRNGMRKWDANAYVEMLIEQARTQEISPAIDALAKECVAKVLR
jgi:hypothetical protein